MDESFAATLPGFGKGCHLDLQRRRRNKSLGRVKCRAGSRVVVLVVAVLLAYQIHDCARNKRRAAPIPLNQPDLQFGLSELSSR